MSPSKMMKKEDFLIREVWAHNLDEEFEMIARIVDSYPFVAMDTEFPGTVMKMQSCWPNTNEHNFRELKANVDLLKMIQLGLTFCDEKGNLPTCGTGKFCVWQFNFREFDMERDMFVQESIDLLKVCGVDFKKNREEGIDAVRFSEMLMSSGVVLNENMNWVTFHSAYDFGYLLKVLTCKNLPATQLEFFKLIKTYFPRVYDIKYIIQFDDNLYGGLNKVGELLNVERIGVSHLAGSDSLHTCRVFIELRERFAGWVDKYGGVLFGLGVYGRR